MRWPLTCSTCSLASPRNVVSIGRPTRRLRPRRRRAVAGDPHLLGADADSATSVGRGDRRRWPRRVEPARRRFDVACRPSRACDDRPRQQVGLPDEIRDEAARRAVVQLARRADLRDPPVLHHRDAVGDAQRLLLVVRHVDRREPRRLADPADLRCASRGGAWRRGCSAARPAAGSRARRPAPAPAPRAAAARRTAVGLAIGERVHLHELEHLGDAPVLLGAARSAHVQPEAHVLARRVMCGQSA